MKQTGMLVGSLRAGSLVGTENENRREEWDEEKSASSSEILNLIPKGDHLGVVQAFGDP